MKCVRLVKLAAVLMFVTVVMAVPAGAQTAVDATTAEFVPSADHSRQAADGTPLVSSYLLEIFTVGSASPVRSLSLGKPAPAADGLIRYDFGPLLTTPLTPGVEYQARVSAVGPGGSAASALSNAFTFTQPCSYALSSTGASIAAAGASVSVNVTAGSTCAWTATTAASWVTINTGAAGTGSGAVSYTVAPNAATSSRSATMSIAGQTYTINQAAAAAPCT